MTIKSIVRFHQPGYSCGTFLERLRSALGFSIFRWLSGVVGETFAQQIAKTDRYS